MNQEGLKSAIDFTKLLMALAGGGIALIIRPNFFAGSFWLKVMFQSRSPQAAANSTLSISVGSSASAFELLTRFDTGQR